MDICFISSMRKYFAILLLLLGACTNQQKKESDSLFPDSSIALKQAFNLIKEKQWEQASRMVNIALQSNMHAPQLHVLNGSIYEYMALKDPGALSLALVAYKSAMGLDPNNTHAMTGLARVFLKKRDFQKARELFANVILLKPNNTEAYYGLACASFGARDIQTARGAILKTLSLAPNEIMHLRMAALISAALGCFDEANAYKDKIKLLNGFPQEIAYIEERVEDWKNFHKTQNTSNLKKLTAKEKRKEKNLLNPNIHFLADEETETDPDEGNDSGDSENNGEGDTGESSDSSGEKAPSAPALPGTEAKESSNNEDATPKSYMIDCIILRISEERNTSRGSNILESFSFVNQSSGNMVQGGGLVLSPQGSTGETNFSAKKQLGYSFDSNGKKVFFTGPDPNTPSMTVDGSPGSGYIKSRGFQLSFDTLRYNLNLFNAAQENVQLSSKQSILAEIGKNARFESGDTLRSADGTDMSGVLASVPSGSKMSITIKDVKNNFVTIKIMGSCSWLIGEQDVNKSIAEQTIKTYETKVDTETILNLGETVVLAALQQDAVEYKRSEVPGLGRMPIAQYLFSNERNQNFKLSAMIMVTVRSSTETQDILKRSLLENPRDFSKLPSVKELINKEGTFALPSNLTVVCASLSRVVKLWLDSDTIAAPFFRNPLPSESYFEWVKSYLVY